MCGVGVFCARVCVCGVGVPSNAHVIIMRYKMPQTQRLAPLGADPAAPHPSPPWSPADPHPSAPLHAPLTADPPVAPHLPYENAPCMHAAQSPHKGKQSKHVRKQPSPTHPRATAGKHSYSCRCMHALEAGTLTRLVGILILAPALTNKPTTRVFACARPCMCRHGHGHKWTERTA